MRLCLALLGAVLASSTIAAQSPIRILTLDSSRFASCSATSYAFANNSFFQFAFLELTNPANFGPNGRVKRGAKFVKPVPSITVAALADADVVIIGQTSDQQRLPFAEVAALNSFLCKGGGVIVFGNWAAQAMMPITQGVLGSFASSTVKTVANTPMTSGPFGASNPQATLPGGWSGAYKVLGPSGTACITRGGEILGASFNVGPGKLIVIADEEIIASTAKAGCGSAGWNIETRKIWLNSFAATVPPTAFTFSANDVVFETFGTGCAPSNSVAPRALWSGRPKSNGFLQATVLDGRSNAVGVWLSGVQRFTQGSCWLHVLPIVFTLPLVTDASGGTSIGASIPSTSGLKGASLITQVVLLDDKGANGLTTSNGTEVRFR